jgi:hypothetical protein
MKAYTIREMEERDFAPALDAWNSVATMAVGVPARTSAEWNWSYRDNPAGRRAFVAECDGAVVALYAAVPVKAWIDGEAAVFGRIVDSLVLPEHRSGLKRPGLFVGVGRAFFERFGGEDTVFFGWPEDAQWRIGERFLGYAPLRHELVLAREVATAAHDWPRGVESIARFEPDVRELYERCARVFGASTVRDDAYMNWRTVDRPGVTYRRFGVRDERGVLRGVTVQRTCAFMGEERSVLVDWLVPHEEEAVADALLAALVATTSADGVALLCGIVPTWSSWFDWFQARGFRAHPTEWVVGGRSFRKRHDVEWLRQRWWYQVSDSDLA